MSLKRNFIFPLVFLTILFPVAVTCPLNMAVSSTASPPSEEQTPSHNLSPAQQHSGELLAYLLKVVLGRAGQLKSREDWRVRAFEEPLDFDHIVKVMRNPEKNQLDFMVLDPDILDLSQVLFHYDEKLSLYKGDYGVTSVYPAPEILALRLFLLKKINSGERMDLDAFIQREGDLLNKDYQPSSEDLAATGLSEVEMKFLRDIFLSEPAFYRYLTCPFLLKELGETDVFASGKLTESIVQSARYTPFRCRPMGPGGNPDAVRIAFLPSMTKEFVYGKDAASLSRHGFKPTEFLDEIFNNLKTEILEATRETLKRKLSKPPYLKLSKRRWAKLWQQIMKHNIAFYVENERPLAIYPENAAQVIGEVCPEADFTVILMGKNIYRAIFFDPPNDLYPSVNRLYMDIMDIEYHEGGEEIDTISQFICSRLLNRIGHLTERMAE